MHTLIPLAFLGLVSCSSPEQVDLVSSSTDADGEVTFTDTQSEKSFTVGVVDAASGEGLEGAEVHFIDGERFDAFQVEIDEYIGRFEVFPPGSTDVGLGIEASAKGWNLFSNHDGWFNSDFLFALNGGDDEPVNAWTYSQQEDAEKMDAMTYFVEHAEQAYQYDGCITREELEFQEEIAFLVIRGGAAIASGGSSEAFFHVVEQVKGTLETVADVTELAGLTDPPDYFHIFTPTGFWVPLNRQGVYLGFEAGYEIGNDGLDNNCDGSIDEQTLELDAD